jgi:ribA/ribD-fused uncharacterized protein
MPKRKGHPTGRSKAPARTSDAIFFYLPNEIPYGIFCQWHPSPITLPLTSFSFLIASSTATPSPSTILAHYPPSITFSCAEQLYMFSKALYFADYAICTRILGTEDPKEQKKLGQAVKGFDEDKWGQVKFRVAVVGNWYKYCQNEEMGKVLLGTGKRELAEASRRDRVWGIGFNAKEADAHRGEWGESLLGRALMRVRRRLGEWRRREKGEKVDWDWDGGNEEEELEGEKEQEDAAEDGAERLESGCQTRVRKD